MVSCLVMSGLFTYYIHCASTSFRLPLIEPSAISSRRKLVDTMYVCINKICIKFSNNWNYAWNCSWSYIQSSSFTLNTYTYIGQDLELQLELSGAISGFWELYPEVCIEFYLNYIWSFLLSYILSYTLRLYILSFT